MEKPMQILHRFTVLAPLCAVLIGCNKGKTPAPPEPELKPVASLTADQMLDEYKKNEVGADQKYKDKFVEISGQVAEIKKDLLGRYFVGLGTSHEGEMFDVMCYLDASAYDDAGKLKKGDNVKLRGACEGRPGGLTLTFKRCWIVK
jgi:tRNA_anti-like